MALWSRSGAQALASARMGHLGVLAGGEVVLGALGSGGQFAHAHAQASFTDWLTLSPSDPARMFTPGTLHFQVNYAGNGGVVDLSTTARVLARWCGRAGNADFSCGGWFSDSDDTGVGRQSGPLPGAVAYEQRFVWGLPVAIGVTLAASVDLTGLNNGSANGHFDLLHSAAWGGILSVSDGTGVLVVPQGYALSSASGTDYRGAISAIPEPGAWLLLLLGAGALGTAGTLRAACRSGARVLRRSGEAIVAMGIFCAMPEAGAIVTPALPTLATARASCGLSAPGVTGHAQSGAWADCSSITVAGELYGEPYSFYGDATGSARLGRLTMTMTARVSGSMNFLGDGFVAQGMSASAGGFMYFDVVETSPAPFVADIPVEIVVLANASVQGNAGAALQVRLDNTTLLNRSFSGLMQPGLVTLTLPWTPLFSLASGVHSISKAASCVIVVDSVNSPTADCSAQVDPILSLDQAAFDAAWGDASFRLDDHYAIRVSANLAPIPEPAAGALLAAGLGLLAWARRKLSPGAA